MGRVCAGFCGDVCAGRMCGGVSARGMCGAGRGVCANRVWWFAGGACPVRCGPRMDRLVQVGVSSAFGGWSGGFRVSGGFFGVTGPLQQFHVRAVCVCVWGSVRGYVRSAGICSARATRGPGGLKPLDLPAFESAHTRAHTPWAGTQGPVWSEKKSAHTLAHTWVYAWILRCAMLSSPRILIFETCRFLFWARWLEFSR